MSTTGMSTRILLVEDRPDLEEPLQDRLAEEGFAVTTVQTGTEALSSAAAIRPEIVLLELALPDVGGLEVCRRLRADRRTAHLPVMILSGEVREREKVLGFEVGANDFLARPFGMNEFVARVKALLRREGSPRRSGILSVGRIELDLDRQLVSVGGRCIKLSAREMALLRELMSRGGLTLRRSFLVDRIWDDGKATPARLRTIDAHVVRLRRSLGSEGRRIVTVRSVGYKFETDDDRIPPEASAADDGSS